jgi:RAB6A-GEF complex partner protein 1
MYWPIGAPRVYAAAPTSESLGRSILWDDGSSWDRAPNTLNGDVSSSNDAIKEDESSDNGRVVGTPSVNGIGHTASSKDVNLHESVKTALESQDKPTDSDTTVLELRVARSGKLFATITRSTLTVWQVKVWIGTRLNCAHGLIQNNAAFRRPCFRRTIR